MKRKNLPESNSTSIAIKFFVVLLIFILMSLSFKAISIIGNSRYHGETPFTVSISNNKELKLLVFSSKPHSLHIIKIKGASYNLNIGRLLAVPIDGEISTTQEIKSSNASELIGKFTLNYAAIKTNLTILDIARLFLFTLMVPKENLYEKSVSSSMASEEIDKITSSIFKDPLIEEENANVKIVNGTNVNGLGSRMARFVSNMGGNVVIISSGEKAEFESSISYFGKKPYTVKRLEKALGFKTIELQKRGITDILIVIGKDREENLVF